MGVSDPICGTDDALVQAQQRRLTSCVEEFEIQPCRPPASGLPLAIPARVPRSDSTDPHCLTEIREEVQALAGRILPSSDAISPPSEDDGMLLAGFCAPQFDSRGNCHLSRLGELMIVLIFKKYSSNDVANHGNVSLIRIASNLLLTSVT